MAGQYAQNMAMEYEKWEKKNVKDAGAFDTWINEQDEKYTDNFKLIQPEILASHFLPIQAEVRDNLRARHTERINKSFRTEAYYEKQGEIFTLFRSRLPELMDEKFKGNLFANFSEQIIRGDGINEQNVDTLTMLRDVLDKANPTENDFKKIPNGLKMYETYKAIKLENPKSLDESKAVNINSVNSSNYPTANAFAHEFGFEGNLAFQDMVDAGLINSEYIYSHDGELRLKAGFILNRNAPEVLAQDKKRKDEKKAT